MLRSKLLMSVILLVILAFLTGCEEGLVDSSFEATGLITDESGEGLVDVSLAFSRGYGVSITDANGKWMKSSLSGTISVSPMKEGWYFEPKTATLTTTQSSANFVGYPNKDIVFMDLSKVSVRDLDIEQITNIYDLNESVPGFLDWPKTSSRVPFRATSREARNVWFYNRATGKFEGGHKNFKSISPSGELIVVGDGIILRLEKQWLSSAEEWVRFGELPERVRSHDWIDNQTLLLLMNDQTIWHYRIDTKEASKIMEIPEDLMRDPTGIGVSATGGFVYVTNDLFLFGYGYERNVFVAQLGSDHWTLVGSTYETGIPIKWSPTEDRLLWVGSSVDRSRWNLREWDSSTETTRTLLTDIQTFDFSPDGSKVVAARGEELIHSSGFNTNTEKAQLVLLDLRDNVSKNLVNGFGPAWVTSNTIVYVGFDTKESFEQGVKMYPRVKSMQLTVAR